jgi:rhodanese-related sulfurtransferase
MMLVIFVVLCSPSALAVSLARSPPHLPPRTSTIIMGRKPGVMDPSDLQTFVTNAGAGLIVVDVRNPDFAVEPGDGKNNEKAPIADCGGARARAVNVIYDRGSSSMDLSSIPQAWIEAGGGKATVPVITHCGGGGRGQKAKEFLEANGFGNVVNGGGPEDDECWQVFGSK